MKLIKAGTIVLMTAFAISLLAEKLPVKSWNYVNVGSLFGSVNSCNLVNSKDELDKVLSKLHYQYAVSGGPFPKVDWKRNTVLIVTTIYTFVQPKSNAPTPDGKRVEFLLAFDPDQTNSGTLIFEIAGKHPALEGCQLRFAPPSKAAKAKMEIIQRSMFANSQAYLPPSLPSATTPHIEEKQPILD
jgi:hypothetical protein